MMGHVIVWITSSVVHSHIWEGELHRHLDHDDIVHERSIHIWTSSTSPDRGIDTWKPFYRSLDCFEFLGEGFFHVSRLFRFLCSVCFLHICVCVHVGIIIIFSRVSSVYVSGIGPFSRIVLRPSARVSKGWIGQMWIRNLHHLFLTVLSVECWGLSFPFGELGSRLRDMITHKCSAPTVWSILFHHLFQGLNLWLITKLSIGVLLFSGCIHLVNFLFA